VASWVPDSTWSLRTPTARSCDRSPTVVMPATQATSMTSTSALAVVHAIPPPIPASLQVAVAICAMEQRMESIVNYLTRVIPDISLPNIVRTKLDIFKGDFATFVVSVALFAQIIITVSQTMALRVRRYLSHCYATAAPNGLPQVNSVISFAHNWGCQAAVAGVAAMDKGSLITGSGLFVSITGLSSNFG
jgi:hypothetical protein